VPSRWEVRLAGPADAAIPLAAPLAAVSGWLDDPPGHRPGQEMPHGSGHNDQARKWTCGPLRAAPADAGGGSEVILQVRLLDDLLGSRLIAATRPGRRIRLGEHRYEVAGRAQQVEQVSWPDLRRWSGSRAWQVRYVTPVCVRRRNQTSPWPAPESVARGLAERWQRLDPVTAPPVPGPGSYPVWVSDIDGHSEVRILARRGNRDGDRTPRDEVISGFLGRIRYVCDRGTDTDAADFGALMAFALFAGAGSHTTYGFGVVQPEPTWQPPTRRPG
jgi:CRISPR/Cas system endoribonuclease Cas6 (RAMP superfamily)